MGDVTAAERFLACLKIEKKICSLTNQELADVIPTLHWWPACKLQDYLYMEVGKRIDPTFDARAQAFSEYHENTGDEAIITVWDEAVLTALLHDVAALTNAQLASACWSYNKISGRVRKRVDLEVAKRLDATFMERHQGTGATDTDAWPTDFLLRTSAETIRRIGLHLEGRSFSLPHDSTEKLRSALGMVDSMFGVPADA